MLERAGIASFFKAAVECVEGGVEVVEENEADKCECKVAARLRESVAKFGAVYETRDVIEHRRAEEGLDGFEDDGTAVGLRDLEIAPEEKKESTEEGGHK